MPARRVIISGREQIDPRHTSAWRRLRDRVVREEPTCRLRFEGICTVVSTTGDHIIPVTERPELALVRSNVRAACKPCNDARRTVPDANLRLGGEPSPALEIFRR
jgi:5-methylcytosine-specific restriction endonuclease McrA